MSYKSRNPIAFILAFSLLTLAILACRVTASPTQIESAPVTQIVSVTQIISITEISPDLNFPLQPEIILQRLTISFRGQDGKKIIGSGCPGTDGKGTIIDYHFVVSGVDENKEVQKILVAGDNSTLTWASPCSNNWALDAKNAGDGVWEIFIAPSLPSTMYTVLFFYTDNTVALGMVNANE